MNVTLTSLEALVLKATHESLPCPDVAALEAFCAVMRDSADGPQLAAQALAARIHTPNPREALLALSMLDRCMRRCDTQFHAEIGKFRFLNEMIKLVSPKYFADRTAPEVQIRVLQLFHAWSIEYSKESKFKVAFEMLKNQGVIKETPPPLPPDDAPQPSRTRSKSAIFEDEEKSKLLQKLLQSKKPEDLQHANRLIKTMVKEEERRHEASSRRAQEVSAALDSAGLLRDMLEHAADASNDEEQLIHELHATCLRLRPVLQRIAACNANTDLEDILHASDVLDEVFEKYNTFVAERRSKDKKPNIDPKPRNSDALLDLVEDGAASVNVEPKVNEVNHTVTKNNVIDDLGDIFSAETASSSFAEPLKPVNLRPNDDDDILSDTCKAEGWNELDSLGEQLMKQSLPENSKRLDNFKSKPTKKIPMNALDKVSPKHEVQQNNGVLFDLDFFTKKPEETKVTKEQPPNPKPVTPNDDVMVDISIDVPKASNRVNHTNSSQDNTLDTILDLDIDKPNENAKCDNNVVKNSDSNNGRNAQSSDVKPLNDLNVTLESVHPSKVPPMTVFEDGDLTVVLHFCKDKPRPDVNVVVISTTSKNSSSIEDFKFQCVVPKGCKVRLLGSSGTSLPPYNPFLPPPALTQVMLLACPPNSRPHLKFLLTYTCDDEYCSEMGEIQLPLEDI